MTKEKFFRDFNDIQNACNPSGVIRWFGRTEVQNMICDLGREHDVLYRDNPLVIALLDKINQLIGLQGSFDKAIDAWRRLDNWLPKEE